ncbi:MAG TPA: MFS transporter, partial [Micromonosporaceae bacterium]|nr:MFS transporter [Micromonosporaceae bacterium]
MANEERLQKVMAAAGVGSRRACEELIDRRRVTVNGKVAKLGDKVDAET